MPNCVEMYHQFPKKCDLIFFRQSRSKYLATVPYYYHIIPNHKQIKTDVVVLKAINFRVTFFFGTQNIESLDLRIGQGHEPHICHNSPSYLMAQRHKRLSSDRHYFKRYKYFEKSYRFLFFLFLRILPIYFDRDCSTLKQDLLQDLEP